MNIWGSKVVGVVEDFHFKTMYNELGFMQLRYIPQSVTHLNIKIAGNNIPATLGIIKDELKEYEPGMAFDPVFYDDWINTLYQREERQASLLSLEYRQIGLTIDAHNLSPKQLPLRFEDGLVSLFRA